MMAYSELTRSVVLRLPEHNHSNRWDLCFPIGYKTAILEGIRASVAKPSKHITTGILAIELRSVTV